MPSKTAFDTVFLHVGDILHNHDAFTELKNSYIKLGSKLPKARFQALGCLSGRSQGSTAMWYKNSKGEVLFKRL